LKASDVQESISLEKLLANQNGISFVVLQLKNSAAKTISENVYWFSPEHNFKELNQMPPVKLEAKIIKSEKLKSETRWILQITNSSKQLAFFINPQITENGKEILPSFWSDNYFSLTPNESTTISVSVPNAKIKDKKLKLALTAWNVGKEIISL